MMATLLRQAYGYPLSGLNHPLLRSVKANFALLYDAVTNVSRPHARARGEVAVDPGVAPRLYLPFV